LQVWNDAVSEILQDADELFVAESNYPLPFITYLSRFLLNFDAPCKSWWADAVTASIPKSFPRR
jgi:hypothetical protein